MCFVGQDAGEHYAAESGQDGEAGAWSEEGVDGDEDVVGSHPSGLCFWVFHMCGRQWRLMSIMVSVAVMGVPRCL